MTSHTSNTLHAALPNDIIHGILSASKFTEGDSVFPPSHSLATGTDTIYHNRYTRFALISRRVCREWRDIIDMRSSYWARVSAVALSLEVYQPANYPEGVPTARLYRQESSTNFQDAISLADTSMLVLRLRFRAQSDGDDQEPIDLGKMDPEGKVNIQKFLDVVIKLLSYQDRLLQLDVYVPTGAFEHFASHVIRSFRQNSILRRLQIHPPASHPRDRAISRLISNPRLIPEISRTLAFADAASRLSISHLMALNHFSWSSMIDPSLHVPPSLTQLDLTILSAPCLGFEDARAILASIGPQLKTVRAGVLPLTLSEKELLLPDRQPIQMPCLESLDVGDGSRTFTNFLHELDCPKLKEANATIWPYMEPEPLQVMSDLIDEVNPRVHLPALKELTIDSWDINGQNDSMLPLLALSVPSLESLVFKRSAPDPLTPSGLSLLTKHPSTLKRLSALPIRSLTFDQTWEAVSSLILLQNCLNTQFIQHLHIQSLSYGGTDSELEPNLIREKLSMPRLRYLKMISSDHPIIFTYVLTLLVLGEEFTTIEIDTSYGYGVLWDEELTKGLQSTLYTIRTFILSSYVWASLDLLRVCPNVTSLIFRIGYGDEFEQCLSLIDPLSCVTSESGPSASKSETPEPLLPRLQDITFELTGEREFHLIPDVTGLRLRIMEVFHEVDARRRALEATPLKNVTINLCVDEFDGPQVEEFFSKSTDSEEGIICRVRIADKDEQPSVLLAKLPA